MVMEEHDGHKHLKTDRLKHTFISNSTTAVVTQRHMRIYWEETTSPIFIQS